MKNSMNVKVNQKGFTLIELVVVIVILGILAVTAAPKFIDLSGDAKASVVQAVEGSLKSAADMAYAKRLVKGVSAGGSMSFGSDTVTFVNGYPIAADIQKLTDISASVSEGADFLLDDDGTDGSISFQHSDASNKVECQVTYSNAAESGDKPEIESVVSDC
ncbi:prepilin-type N-terminal cleavage/methylation domain-containing protein [Colwellia sp. E2M01]|uniref:type II secretion system protein n=1 Tax=Colwellia sp. E2M01 TaxID=2841561 RepID=UPI001C08A2E2|nr:prepilin-type N-terminal cleavage/methylation domain-containing protein [Colwellia sp. E2M01]MBU2870304.1 prepilin-type N-terminal cleavage/methylation domain-containing protein [Colwellia sp. E2M01]